MSYVIASPEYVEAAATDLANIGSTISSANSAALGPASSVAAPGADEVSAGIAALFDAHAQAYQALSDAASAFHAQFVQLMNGGAAQYALTEAANASPLQTTQPGLLSGANAPSHALTTAEPVVSSTAPAASVAAGVPGATAGLAAGAAPAAPAGPVATAVPPASAVPRVLAPATTPVAAAPAGSATLAQASTPAAAMQPATPAYSPATSPVTAEPVAPGPANTPVAAVQAETPEFSPATAAPTVTPVAAAPTATPAYSPATPPYSPAAAASAESPREQSAVMVGRGEIPPYSA